MAALKNIPYFRHDSTGSSIFFPSSPHLVDSINLASRVWFPALERAGQEQREMKQARHSFATVALAALENPNWVAKMMGHRNTEMIFKVYGKYVADTLGIKDGEGLVKAREKAFGNEG